MSKIKKKIAFCQKIKIIDHKVLQRTEFAMLKTLISIVIQMLKKKIAREILKYCHESYRNFYFLMKKINQTNIDSSIMLSTSMR